MTTDRDTLEWEPIETAPDDGTEIEVVYPDGEREFSSQKAGICLRGQPTGWMFPTNSRYQMPWKWRPKTRGPKRDD